MTGIICENCSSLLVYKVPSAHRASKFNHSAAAANSKHRSSHTRTRHYSLPVRVPSCLFLRSFLPLLCVPIITYTRRGAGNTQHPRSHVTFYEGNICTADAGNKWLMHTLRCIRLSSARWLAADIGKRHARTGAMTFPQYIKVPFAFR